jgi:phage repressor protein C with HTH and peptisase S24 domain
MNKQTTPQVSSTVGQRVKEQRKFLNLTQGALADLCGLTQPTISALEKGHAHTSGSLPSIAAALGVDALWLETGKGEKLPAGAAGTGTSSSNLKAAKAKDAAPKAPVYRIPLQVAPQLSRGNRSREKVDASPISLSARLFAKIHLSSPSNLVAMEEPGEAMAPYISRGDLVVYDTGVQSFNGGGVYVLNTPDGLRIKRMHRCPDGRLLLTTDNPDKNRYPDDEVTAEMAATLPIAGKLSLRLGG